MSFICIAVKEGFSVAKASLLGQLSLYMMTLDKQISPPALLLKCYSGQTRQNNTQVSKVLANFDFPQTSFDCEF